MGKTAQLSGLETQALGEHVVIRDERCERHPEPGWNCSSRCLLRTSLLRISRFLDDCRRLMNPSSRWSCFSTSSDT